MTLSLQQSQQSADPSLPGGPPGTLNALCQSVIPVWAGQIGLARAEMEDAALNLVNHFIGIAGRVDQIAGAIEHAEANVSDVGALQDSFHILRTERAAISEAVRRGIIALQFQDRVNQVLAHVCTDLDKLRQRVDEHGHLPASFDICSWLDALIRTYSVQQQHEVHSGGAPTATVDSGDIEMF